MLKYNFTKIKSFYMLVDIFIFKSKVKKKRKKERKKKRKKKMQHNNS